MRLRTRATLFAIAAFALVFAGATAAIVTSNEAQAAKPGSVDQPECLGPGLRVAHQADPGARLVASFATTVQQFVTWEENRNPRVKPTSPQRGRPAAERIALCYYDGTYTGIPTLPGASIEYTRMIVVVMADGSTRVVNVGPKQTNPLTAP